MTKNLKYKFLTIVGITVICLYGIFGIPTSMESLRENLNQNIKLGLDLRGGSHLVMQIQLQDAFEGEADLVIQRLQEEFAAAGISHGPMIHNDLTSIEEAEDIRITINAVDATRAGDARQIITDNYGDVWNVSSSGSDLEMTMQTTAALALKQDTVVQTMNTIERKINSLGLAESTVQQRGGSNAEAELLVQLPGVDDPARIKQLLKTAANLEIYEVQGGPYPSPDAARQAQPSGVIPLSSQLFRSASRGGSIAEWYVMARTPVVTGRDIRGATPQQNIQTRTWETQFVLSQDAARRFEAFTGANIGSPLAIVLDDSVIQVATIQARIGDTGVITNMASFEETSDLALNLRAGSLPAGLEYLEERSVGPSLGADSIRAGFMAGLAGVCAVVAVMLIYYKRAGINATVALILNAVILIAVLAYFGAVLTLPGIAGIILTIGMAVDSNVLTFERIREELSAGKAVPTAIDIGFSKAFLTIIDTHLTTIISCLLLFLFGTGPVKGFAITLSIGLVANIFTAIFVSRTMFEWSLSGERKPATLSI